MNRMERLGCLWAILLSIPLWIVILLIVRFICVR
jgi:hypothetical protein